ncbi:MAG: hypothetical protein QW343_04435, partial [Candidatus Norongarragalinales archaeon]
MHEADTATYLARFTSLFAARYQSLKLFLFLVVSRRAKRLPIITGDPPNVREGSKTRGGLVLLVFTT